MAQSRNSSTKLQGPDQSQVKSFYPILRPAPHNNYVEWLEQFLLISQATFCAAAVRFSQTHNECIFARMEYAHGYCPKDPNDWDNEAGDAMEAELQENLDEIEEEAENLANPTTYQHRYKRGSTAWYAKRDRFNADRAAMCAHIELALSQESRLQIRAHQGEIWTDAVRRQDPYILLLIIRRTHTVAGGAVASIFDEDAAVEAVRVAQQSRSESLELYRERFIELVRRCRELGIDEGRLPEVNVTLYFVKGVTDPSAKLTKIDLVTKHANDRAAFPRTVNSAFNILAATIKTMRDASSASVKREPRTNNATANAASAGRQQKTPSNKGRVQQTNNKRSANKKSDTRSTCCGYCKKTGHVAQECFQLKELLRTNGSAGDNNGRRGSNQRVRFKDARSPSDTRKANKANRGRDKRRVGDDEDTEDEDIDDSGDRLSDAEFIADEPPPNKKRRGAPNTNGKRKSPRFNMANLAQVVTEQIYANPAMALTNAAKKGGKTMSSSSNAFKKRSEIILDTGANIHIVNELKLLRKVNFTDPLLVKGVSNKRVMATMCGTFGPFGKAYYLSKCTFNILSLSVLKNEFHVKYDSALYDSFDVNCKRTGKLIARFTANEDGMYVLDGTEDDAVDKLLQSLVSIPQEKDVGAKVFVNATQEDDVIVLPPPVLVGPDEPVNNNDTAAGQKVTAGEKERGKAAMDLHRLLGHVNDVYLGKLLDARGIHGTHLTSKDVATGRRLHGPCPACAQGKATVKALKKSDKPSGTPPSIGHTFHGDIVYIGNNPHLRMSEAVTKYGTLIRLEKKDKTTLAEALRVHFGTMLGLSGANARIFKTDNEIVFTSISPELAKVGILLQQAPSGNHCGAIEAQVRADRQALRAMLADLPYSVPACLHSYAAVDAVRIRNLTPNSTLKNAVTPLEAFTGRKPSMSDIGVRWGSIVYATKPTHPSDKAAARAELGIVVGHNIETRPGSVDVLLITADKKLNIVNRPTRLIREVTDQPFELTRVKEFMASVKGGTPTTFLEDTEIIQYNPLETATTTVVQDQRSGETADDTTIVSTLDNSAPYTPAADPQQELPTLPHNSSSPPASTDTEHVVVVPHQEPDTATNSQEQQPTPDNNADDPLQIPPPGLQPRELRNREALKMPSRYANALALNVSVKKALRTHGNVAKLTIQSELRQLFVRKTVIPLMDPKDGVKSKHTRIIPSSMFLKEKYLADGTFEKLKARLVAGGHRVDQTLYGRDETFAATIKYESLLMTLSVASYQDRELETFDFPAAFLNGVLKNPQVMKLERALTKEVVEMYPQYSKFVQKDGTMLLNVIGALYGLPEAGNIWLNKITTSLKKIGYQQSFDDPCLFNRQVGKEQSTICVHVDDLVHTYTRGATRVLKDLHQAFQKEYKEVKNTKLKENGSISYLGLNIERVKGVTCNDGKIRNGFRITMPSYVENALREIGVTGTSKVPASANCFRVDPKSEQIGSPTAFLARVMKLMYLAKRYRFDILATCSFLATRAASPTKEDWNKLHRLYKYINGSKDLPLILAPDSLDLCAYIDASYNVHSGARSHSGRVIGLGSVGGPALVKSTKQHLVSRSSTEAELISLADGTGEVLYMQRLLNFLLGKSSRRSAVVFQDNKSTIQMAESGRGGKTGNTKHIEARYFFIKQHLDDGKLTIKHLATKDMTADLLTKPLTGSLFQKHRAGILNLARVEDDQ